jgi:Type IV pilin-like G and H, putative
MKNTMIITSMFLSIVASIHINKIALATSGNEPTNFIAEVFYKQNKYKGKNRLAPSLKALKMKAETKNYRYQYKIKSDTTVVIAIPKNVGLNSYIGAGSIACGPNDGCSMVSVICHSLKPSRKPPAMPILRLNQDTPSGSCASGTINSTDN